MTIAQTVTHNISAHRFECVVEGHLCRVDYRPVDGALDLYHTEVPKILEGRGLASLLVRAAFDHARHAGVGIRPSCSYVRAWARRHPDEGDLLRG